MKARVLSLALLVACKGSSGSPPPPEPSIPPAAEPGSPPPAFVPPPASPAPAADSVPDGGTLDPVTAYELHDDTIIVLQRSTCFGRCPAYSVGVRGDGQAFFHGERATTTKGFASASIDRAQIASLLAFMKTRRFHELADDYPPRATDHPLYTTLLRRGESVKRIFRDSGNEDAPALVEIEKEIDRIAGSARWVGRSTAPGGRGFETEKAPAIPSAGLRALGGPALATVERECTGKKLEIHLQVDEWGRFAAAGGIIDDTQRYACVQKRLSKVFVPLLGAYGDSKLILL